MTDPTLEELSQAICYTEGFCGCFSSGGGARLCKLIHSEAITLKAQAKLRILGYADQVASASPDGEEAIEWLEGIKSEILAPYQEGLYIVRNS